MNGAEGNNRLIILTFIGFYLPGYKAGGPIRSIANMVERMGDEFDFRIVTADRDMGDTNPYPDVAIDTWNPCGKASVFYRSPGSVGWRALLASLRSVDFNLVYLNSMFSASGALRPLIYRRLGMLADRPVLLAPRGECSAGALAFKAAKKRGFLAVARVSGLYRNVTFQASSDSDARDIGQVFDKARIVVASNMTGAPSTMADAVASPRALDAPLRAAFLSRISPIKNLLGALNILARASCPVEYSIHGIVEDAAYWAECQARIASLPDHVMVQYKGEVRPDQVEGVLAPYDFFFLPTLGENYGHVIREALSAGLPVLVSDRTPWRGLAARNAGADLPLDDPDAFVRWIEEFHGRSPAQRLAMRDAARQLGSDPAKAEIDLTANRAMLHAAMHC